MLSLFIFSNNIFFPYFARFICMVDFKNQDQIKYATDEATENITNELKGKKFDYFRYRYVICFTDTHSPATILLCIWIFFFGCERNTFSAGILKWNDKNEKLWCPFCHIYSIKEHVKKQ